MPRSRSRSWPADDVGAGDPVLRIKRRLMDRVAGAADPHFTLGAADGVWLNVMPGIVCKVLHEDADGLSCLLHLAPRSRIPAHRHRVREELLLLRGRIWVGTRLLDGLGAYQLAEPGTLHASIVTDVGALLWVRGVLPTDDDLLC